MQTVTVSESCAAPVEVVWRIATDLASMPETMSGISAVDVLSEGEFGVGTRWRETRTMYGKQASEELVITAMQPGRSYTAQAESAGMRYVTTFDFSPTDAGTDIVMTFGGEATGRAAKAMSMLTGWAMVGSVRKAVQKDLADIAAAAQAQT
ncbi:MAG: SRPBCC family protein [Jiangellales bacterium]